MDRSKYIREVMGQLNDSETYRELPYDPKWEIQTHIKRVLMEAKDRDLIDASLYNYLLILHPVTPMLYVLPKIHKTLIDPPGRPIVSEQGSVTSHISIFLDGILRPYASSAKSYIRDTGDFLNKLSEIHVPEGAILASFDHVSLYTSIPHDGGVQAVSSTISADFSPARSTFLTELLYIVLTKNHFMFHDTHYIQCRGTAMGTNVAPTYANIYMAHIEESIIYVCHHFGQVLRWWRYIDDVFLMWTGSVIQLQAFHEFLNSMIDSIKFTLTFSPTTVNFLDTQVTISGHQLVTDIYVKPTDCNLTLDTGRRTRAVLTMGDCDSYRTRVVLTMGDCDSYRTRVVLTMGD
ncbi:uncharacterized protein LOC130306859 [Hyla sarda]|uniref:uncharacterized protein LOC130306859 n=1 Tax=Hyla sarda TaxID=327740 RepID=UPI0024C3AA3E|nr:uncharacterized protein LOC130306859 [Hyla sarda]